MLVSRAYLREERVAGRDEWPYVNDRPRTALGESLELDLTELGLRMKQRTRIKQKGYFLLAETAFASWRRSRRASCPATGAKMSRR